MCKEFLCNKEQCKFKCNYCVLRETFIIHFILSIDLYIQNFSKNFSWFFGKCAKFVQNFALFCRKGAKSVQKFCAVLRAKHKTLLVLRVFCAISNGSALFCFAQNAQKQRKTAHFAQIRKEMHIPASDPLPVRSNNIKHVIINFFCSWNVAFCLVSPNFIQIKE